MKPLHILIAAFALLVSETKGSTIEQLFSASTTNPVDATWLIVNPSFETGDETGWTLIGKDPNGNDEFRTRDYGMSGKDGQYLMNAYQWWASSLSVSQTVSDVPSGIYEISAVVATWEGRNVWFSANGTTENSTGINDATGIPVSIALTIGIDQTLAISAGSTGTWWVEGHENETQTFFKLDDVRLTCKGVFLNGIAKPLPNDNTTTLTPEQWYYYDAPYPTQYLLRGDIEGMTYSTDGRSFVSEITTHAVEHRLTFAKGRVYFKTEHSGATLVVDMEKHLQQANFTAAALNVDGLPQKILAYNLNEDGPGESGTKLISQYLASKGYDIIGTSEDFNYHGSLMSALSNNYSSGTIRSTLSVGGLLSGGLPFDTDGLNLIWKNSKTSATNESWTRWNETTSTDGNQYVKKGFRHYDLTLDNGMLMDVYVLHMDAGDAIASRESQWRQLADAINNADATRPKLIIGDTNSRWTREEIKTNFMDRLNRLTAADAWVELCRSNIYPTTAMGDIGDESDPTNYGNYEVVDKIIYLNPVGDNTLQLTPVDFRIEQDYTYGTVQGTDNTQQLGDHRPLVVEFQCTLAGDVKSLLGDVNRDGKVDITDVTALVDIILGKDAHEPYQYDHAAADVDMDARLTITDVTALIGIILKAN